MAETVCLFSGRVMGLIPQCGSRSQTLTASRGALGRVVQEFGLTAKGNLNSVSIHGDGEKQMKWRFSEGRFPELAADGMRWPETGRS